MVENTEFFNSKLQFKYINFSHVRKVLVLKMYFPQAKFVMLLFIIKPMAQIWGLIKI